MNIKYYFCFSKPVARACCEERKQHLLPKTWLKNFIKWKGSLDCDKLLIWQNCTWKNIHPQSSLPADLEIAFL